MLAAIPVLCLLLWMLKIIYLRASRPLREIQLEAHAAIVDHFKSVSADVVSIRAYDFQSQSLSQMINTTEEALRPEYLLRSLQSWLNLVLDLSNTALAAMLGALVVGLHGHSPGWVGVALTAVIKLGQDIKLLLVWWTSLELSLNVVSRTMDFAHAAPADSEPSVAGVPMKWPTQGKVTIKDLSCAHE
jgi:ABC-type multidrug transport system fused ATPase/permease subunit